MFIEPEEPVEPMQPIADLYMEGLLGEGITAAYPEPDGRPNTVPTVGDVWYNRKDNNTYVYYTDTSTSQSIQIGGSAK